MTPASSEMSNHLEGQCTQVCYVAVLHNALQVELRVCIPTSKWPLSMFELRKQTSMVSR